MAILNTFSVSYPRVPKTPRRTSCTVVFSPASSCGVCESRRIICAHAFVQIVYPGIFIPTALPSALVKLTEAGIRPLGNMGRLATGHLKVGVRGLSLNGYITGSYVLVQTMMLYCGSLQAGSDFWANSHEPGHPTMA